MLRGRPVHAGKRRYNPALFRKVAEMVDAHEETKKSGQKARKGDSREGWSEGCCPKKANPISAYAHAHERYIKGTSETE